MHEPTTRFDSSLPEELLGWSLPRTMDEMPGLAELAERLRDSHLNWRLVESLTQFQPSAYTRTTLGWTPACELLLLCWMPGQSSRVHDHGGSYGASLVLLGELEETRFAWTDTHLEPHLLHTARSGDVLLERPETIHRVDNRFATGAVSLHLYAPPMSGMTNYDDDVREPASPQAGEPNRRPR